jgi:general secretion pathway protein F
MPRYSYIAKDRAGAEVRGALEASTRKAAIRQLSQRRLNPLRLEEGSSGEKAAAPRRDLSRLFAPVRELGAAGAAVPQRKDRLPFLRALSELVGCGVQTGDAVRLLSKRVSNRRLKALAAAMWDDLREGKSLSAAMQAKPVVFDEASVHLVEAGEATGSLAEILARLVIDLEERAEIRGRVLAALAYPVFMMVMAVGVIGIFLFFLLPRIESLLDSLGDRLPLSTRLLIGVSEFSMVWGPFLLIGACLGAAGVWAWRRTPPGRLRFDELVLRIAGLGGFFRDSDLLRVTQTLSLLLENGVTTIPALTMTERSIVNRSMRVRFAEARAKIAEGAPIASTLAGTGYFPDLVVDMLTVGENTGRIVPSLKNAANYFQKRISQQIAAFMGVLSVGVLLVAFAFVALIAFGIISSVFQLSNSLRV